MELGGLTGSKKGPAKAVVAPVANRFHWHDPSLSTETSKGEKTFACFSVLGVAGSSPGRTSYPTLANSFPNCPASIGLAKKVDSLRAPPKICEYIESSQLISSSFFPQGEFELPGEVGSQAEVDGQAVAAVALPNPPDHGHLPEHVVHQRPPKGIFFFKIQDLIYNHTKVTAKRLSYFPQLKLA